MKKITAVQFGVVVNEFHSQWPADYVQEQARGVLDGQYGSTSPAAGSDIFYVRRDGDAIIASTRQDEELKEFELTA